MITLFLLYKLFFLLALEIRENITDHTLSMSFSNNIKSLNMRFTKRIFIMMFFILSVNLVPSSKVTTVLASTTSNILSPLKNVVNNLKKKEEYTPLLFFKLPKGQLKSCDDMEEIICKIEKDLNVKVQRFDILRDRHARKLYEKIDEIEFIGKIPLLYHRESRQSIYGLDSVARVRSWAKGRWLSPVLSSDSGEDRVSDFTLDDENDTQTDELYYEEDLTELQMKGKEKMIERMQNNIKN